jgi:hypothetical protein
MKFLRYDEMVDINCIYTVLFGHITKIVCRNMESLSTRQLSWHGLINNFTFLPFFFFIFYITSIIFLLLLKQIKKITTKQNIVIFP